MAKSYAQRLEEIQSAIEAIELGAQSFSIADRSFTRADLATLYKQEQRYVGLAAREANGRSGPRVWRAVPQ